jgi:hypothetical protein
MRRPSPSRLFLPALLLISSQYRFGLAAPVTAYHDERDLSGAVGELIDDFGELLNDTASLLSRKHHSSPSTDPRLSYFGMFPNATI